MHSFCVSSFFLCVCVFSFIFLNIKDVYMLQWRAWGKKG